MPEETNEEPKPATEAPTTQPGDNPSLAPGIGLIIVVLLVALSGFYYLSSQETDIPAPPDLLPEAVPAPPDFIPAPDSDDVPEADMMSTSTDDEDTEDEVLYSDEELEVQ